MATTHTVADGENSETIAKQAGLPWDVIWNHPDNKALHDKYGGDEKKLVTGDTLSIPEPQKVDAGPGASGNALKGQKTRQFFLEQAYNNAFGTYDPDAWDATKGWAGNRARVLKLYDYYAKLFLGHPDLFFWAGLGRMAGGAVVGGMDTYLRMPLHGEDFLTNRMVQIGKDIFHDLAWMHEAFLDSADTALRLAADRDLQRYGPKGVFPRKDYAKAWTKIASGDAAQVFEGNAMLLENEQWVIIQPRYDEVLAKGDTQWEFNKTSAFTTNIHPYHRRFQLVLPSGNVAVDADRWAWITETDGMWPKWMVMPGDERKRLAGLSMDDLTAQRWGTVIDSLVPPGAHDSEDQS